MKKIIALFLCLLLLCGCAAKEQAESGKFRIVTTNFVCFDFARAVAGDTADISMLVSPGEDIHSFEPSARDVANINDCDLFIYIGGESDVWADKILSSLKTKNILKLIDGISLIKNGNTYDEHIWTSPENANKMIDSVLKKLCETNPENAEKYRKNAAEYVGKITAATADIKAITETAKVKKIVVADRFPLIYFTEYFGIQYIAAFGGCEHDTDADLHTVTELIEAINNDGLPIVYCMGGSGLSVADTVATATNVPIAELRSFQDITPDEFEKGITYIDIMNINAEALRRGLS